MLVGHLFIPFTLTMIFAYFEEAQDSYLCLSIRDHFWELQRQINTIFWSFNLKIKWQTCSISEKTSEYCSSYCTSRKDFDFSFVVSDFLYAFSKTLCICKVLYNDIFCWIKCSERFSTLKKKKLSTYFFFFLYSILFDNICMNKYILDKLLYLSNKI